MRVHWNTWKTRHAANEVIRMQLPDSYHWSPKKSDYECTSDNLDLVPFVIVLNYGKIVSVCIPKFACDNSTLEIVVLATHPEYLGK